MSRRAAGATVAWDVARVLLVGCLVSLAVAAWFALAPVENPGVQDCGAPIGFIATNEDDALIPLGTPDSPVDAPALRAQAPCSERVVVPLQRAGLFTAVGIALGVAGAVLGLLDDRIALRRSPPFEDLVRPRPADAPGRRLDPLPTPVEDLGEDLPVVERAEVVLQVAGWAIAAVALVAVAGVDDVATALGRVGLTEVVVVAVLVIALRAAAALGRWWSLGADGRPMGVPVTEVLDVAAAADWEARARPELGVAGLDVHHLVRGLGVARDAARARVGAFVAVAGVVHLAALVVVAVGGVPSVPEPDGREYLLLVGGVVVVLLVGMARLPGVLRSMSVVPTPGDLATAVGADRRAGSAGAAVAAVVGIVLQVGVVAVVADVAGVGLSGRVLALVVLVGITVGALSPFGGGAGLTEAVVVLLAWRWGAPPGAVVATVLVWRLAGTWLPMGPGWLAGRRLRDAGLI